MVTAQRSQLAVILVAGLLSAKSGIDGSRDSCPPAAVVDLTGEAPDNLGFVNKSGDLFPPESFWFENDTILGCPCDFKLCVPLCCPVGYAGSVDGCVADNFTFQSLQNDCEKSTGERHVFVNDPCSLSWTNDMLQREDFVPSGHEESYNLTYRFRTLDWRGFCVIRKPDSWEYFRATCTNFPDWNHPWICLLTCACISTLFASATFIVYTVIPELKNFSGSILRCYLVSYISCTVLMSLNVTLISWAQSSSEIIFGFFYFGVACMLWLNVMSLDIWKTFRKFRPNGHDNIKVHQTAKFLRYSIYAWGFPALCTLSVLLLNGFGTMYESTLESIKWYIMISPLISIAVCNTCLYISTALTIRQRKKETAHMVDGVNKHQKENEQRFNLYVKLFVIMGAPQVLFAVAFYGNNEKFYCVIYVIEALQGISMFFMFVWKDDVKVLLHKRFIEIIRRFGAFLQLNHTKRMIQN